MDTMKTGGYLAALRKGAGMTQQEVADRLGVSNKTISKWESGGGFPDIAILPALAELYGVTADDILAGETVRRAAASGDGQVEQYLAHRGELRWRIGYAVAMLCLLTAVLFRSYIWAWLLLAGSAAAVWIGWGRCGRAELRTRLLMLFPLAAALTFMILGKCFPVTTVQSKLQEALACDWYSAMTLAGHYAAYAAWDLTLLLLAPVYALAQRFLRRHGDGTGLLQPTAFRWALAGWIVSLVVEIPRWLVVTPRLIAYIQDPVFGDLEIRSAYASTARWFMALRWAVIAAAAVLAIRAERKQTAEKDAAE